MAKDYNYETFKVDNQDWSIREFLSSAQLTVHGLGQVQIPVGYIPQIIESLQALLKHRADSAPKPPEEKPRFCLDSLKALESSARYDYLNFLGEYDNDTDIHAFLDYKFLGEHLNADTALIICARRDGSYHGNRGKVVIEAFPNHAHAVEIARERLRKVLAGSEEKVEKPLYESDCSNCVFLKNYERVSLYFCKAHKYGNKNEIVTVRYGAVEGLWGFNGHQDFYSSIRDDTVRKVHGEARRVALERGLVKYVEMCPWCKREQTPLTIDPVKDIRQCNLCKSWYILEHGEARKSLFIREVNVSRNPPSDVPDPLDIGPAVAALTDGVGYCFKMIDDLLKRIEKLEKVVFDDSCCLAGE